MSARIFPPLLWIRWARDGRRCWSSGKVDDDVDIFFEYIARAFSSKVEQSPASGFQNIVDVVVARVGRTL